MRKRVEMDRTSDQIGPDFYVVPPPVPPCAVYEDAPTCCDAPVEPSEATPQAEQPNPQQDPPGEGEEESVREVNPDPDPDPAPPEEPTTLKVPDIASCTEEDLLDYVLQEASQNRTATFPMPSATTELPAQWSLSPSDAYQQLASKSVQMSAKQQASVLGKEVLPTPHFPVGECLFASVRSQGVEKSLQLLREMAVTVVMCDSDLASTPTVMEVPDRYQRHKLQGGTIHPLTWGDDVLVAALARALARGILLVIDQEAPCFFPPRRTAQGPQGPVLGLFSAPSRAGRYAPFLVDATLSTFLYQHGPKSPPPTQCATSSFCHIKEGTFCNVWGIAQPLVECAVCGNFFESTMEHVRCLTCHTSCCSACAQSTTSCPRSSPLSSSPGVSTNTPAGESTTEDAAGAEEVEVKVEVKEECEEEVEQTQSSSSSPPASRPTREAGSKRKRTDSPSGPESATSPKRKCSSSTKPSVPWFAASPENVTPSWFGQNSHETSDGFIPCSGLRGSSTAKIPGSIDEWQQKFAFDGSDPLPARIALICARGFAQDLIHTTNPPSLRDLKNFLNRQHSRAYKFRKADESTFDDSPYGDDAGGVEDRTLQDC